MAARFPHVRTCFLGQSQCLAFLAGGGAGEVSEPGFPNRPALDYYRENLTALMPGVARSDGYSAVGSTACFKEYTAGGAFWNITGGTPETNGTAAANVMTNSPVAGGLAVYVHYYHGQDVTHGSWNAATAAAGMSAFYAWLYAQAMGAGWGEVRILPVLAAAWTTINGSALRNFRRIQMAIAGCDVMAGATRLSYVLPPVSNSTMTLAASIDGLGDYLHVTKGGAVSNAHMLAHRVAMLNGFAPPIADQPRLFRAIKSGGNVKAFISTPRGLPLLVQRANALCTEDGTPYTLNGADASRAASHRYVVLDATPPAPLAPGARLYYGAQSMSAWYASSTPPRGPCPGIWETSRTDIGDTRADSNGQLPLGFDPSFPVAQVDRGIHIEEP